MAKKFTFQLVVLDRQHLLGSGRYGTTYQAHCDYLLCAGKVMNPGLFESSEQGGGGGKGGGGGRGGGGKLKKSLVTNFQQEVAGLRCLGHPHLVLYLGTSIDINLQLPLLLMELCNENLTSFLNKLQESLPYHKELKLLHGIALALAFLHAHGIIHCNLSSNNVFVMPGPTAKVSDYGMSKVVSSTKYSSLQCCGDPAYLPPEALSQPPHLTPKTDCFSWGVLAMQTLTQQPPLPPPSAAQPPSPGGREQTQVPAAVVASSEEQHKVTLMLIDSAHPLLSITRSALRQMEGHRPPIEVISQSLAQLKKEKEFHESVQRTPSELSELENTLGETKNRLGQKDNEIRRLRAELEEMKRQAGLCVYLQKQVQHKEKTIERLRQQIREMKGGGRGRGEVGVGRGGGGGGVAGGIDEGDGDMEGEGGEMMGRGGERWGGGGGERTTGREEKAKEEKQKPEQEEDIDTPRSLSWKFQSRKIMWPSSQRRSSSPSVMTHKCTSSTSTDFKLAAKVGNGAPTAMARGSSAVHGIKAYFAPMDTRDRKIYVCQLHIYSRNVSWTHLPECPHYDFGLASVNDLLTAVGGYQQEYHMSEPTNSLLSLSETNSNGKWEQKLQPMPTKRRLPAVAIKEHLLIVAGGQGARNEILSTVEVLNATTSQWSTVQPLPIPLMRASIAVCDNNIYIAGGKTEGGPTQAAFCSPLQNPSSSLIRGSHAPQISPWQQILNTPTLWCTLVSQGGHLLALGGQDSHKNCSQTIYTYVPGHDLWATAGNMRHKRSATLAAVLTDETLVVVGGFTKRDEITNAAEIIVSIP